MFKGKTVLVTGAAQGIGSATAKAFAKEGARLVLVDIQDLIDAKQELMDLGAAGVQRVKMDVSTPVAVENAFNFLRDEGVMLDVLANNAGVEEPPAEEFFSQTDDAFDRVFGVNVRGLWTCMRHGAALMRGRGGVIVNTSSVAGLVGFPAPLYTASKHAVVGLTKSAAVMLAPENIRVNAVCPGAVETPLLHALFDRTPDAEDWLRGAHPLNRFASSEEIADAILWLASPNSSFVTGHSLVVDGGFTAQ